MTNITAHEITEVEIVEDAAAFFAPADTDMVDGLIGQYRHSRREIAEVAAFVASRLDGGAIDYFLEGNRDENAGRHALAASARKLFDEAGAVRALNSAYWSKALALTDVLDAMPQARRTEWHEQISSHKCPDFEEATVRDTLATLLAMRTQFLAERVDGIFRALSGEHVTNAPDGFGRRMIIARMFNEWSSPDSQRAGYINDLRCVIAKFMGRDEPRHTATDPVLRAARHRVGEWISVDGGALRIRAYKIGTAHLEVHPDMAWRLNCVLAQIHPRAIPAQFRQKPKKRLREFDLLKRPIPFRVIEALAGMTEASEPIPEAERTHWRSPTVRPVKMSRAIHKSIPREVREEAERVLAAIGGVKQAGGHWLFDYEPAPVLSEIVVSGCIPDQRAHQFYPTPRAMAERLVELAYIGPDHAVLEPSAGMGGLADLLPMERTLCIEVAELHAKVLRAKGFTVEAIDFLTLDAHAHRFARIVMNPPFSDGRWQAHVQHAAGMLAPGGRLAAILPSSARERLAGLLPGLHVECHGRFDNAFPGVSVSVVMMTAAKEGGAA